MSYAEYMRTKAAGRAVVLNTRKPTDSSMMTLKKKQMASSVFAVGGNPVGSTIAVMDRSGNSNAARSYVKPSGKSANSSAYTDYLGAMAIRNDAAAARGRIVQNNDPANCNTPALPTPYFNGCGVNNGGLRQANTVSLSGSDFVRQQIAAQLSRNPIPHSEPGSKPAGPVFVDNTISLGGYSNCQVGCPSPARELANHHQKDIRAPQPLYNPNPPSQANGRMAVMGLPVTQQPSYKAGAAIPRPKTYNLGGTKKHGNDFNVNPARNIVRYQGPPGSKPHLRLNQPIYGQVKPGGGGGGGGFEGGAGGDFSGGGLGGGGEGGGGGFA